MEVQGPGAAQQGGRGHDGGVGGIPTEKIVEHLTHQREICNLPQQREI